LGSGRGFFLGNDNKEGLGLMEGKVKGLELKVGRRFG